MWALLTNALPFLAVFLFQRAFTSSVNNINHIDQIIMHWILPIIWLNCFVHCTCKFYVLAGSCGDYICRVSLNVSWVELTTRVFRKPFLHSMVYLISCAEILWFPERSLWEFRLGINRMSVRDIMTVEMHQSVAPLLKLIHWPCV
jgi:hypothetical protein